MRVGPGIQGEEQARELEGGAVAPAALQVPAMGLTSMLRLEKTGMKGDARDLPVQREEERAVLDVVKVEAVRAAGERECTNERALVREERTLSIVDRRGVL